MWRYSFYIATLTVCYVDILVFWICAKEILIAFYLPTYSFSWFGLFCAPDRDMHTSLYGIILLFICFGYVLWATSILRRYSINQFDLDRLYMRYFLLLSLLIIRSALVFTAKKGRRKNTHKHRKCLSIQCVWVCVEYTLYVDYHHQCAWYFFLMNYLKNKKELRCSHRYLCIVCL